MEHVMGNDNVQMSGALPDNIPPRQSNSRPESQPSVDHVILAENPGPRSDNPAAAGQRRQSFFVVSELQRDAQGNIEAPERIEIKPAQRTTTFEIGRPKRRREKRTRLSSLEAILRAHTDPAAHIPLPESRTTSLYSDKDFGSGFVSRKESKSSLDFIAQHDPFSLPRPLPANLPLPDSRPESMEEHNQLQQQQQSQTTLIPPHLRCYNYERTLAFASEVLPHLTTGKVHASSRRDTLNISYIDYGPSSRSSLMLNGGDVRNDYVIDWLGTIPETVKQRLIIVEDLSPRTIHCLGTRFGVSPEFFEEHLINSGYDGSDYGDLPSHTWMTSGMKKSYSSVKWHRPVNRLPVAPYSKQDLRDLLDPSCGRVEYTSEMSSDLTIFQTESNIFRSEWELWTDPKTTTRMERVCGWEERASIWSQKLPDRDCRIVILLLDPLPTLGEGIERDILAARKLDGSSSGSDMYSQSDAQTDDAIALDRIAGQIKERYVTQPQISRLQRIRDFIVSMGKPALKDDGASEISQAFEIVETTKFNKIRSSTIFDQIAPRADLKVNFEETFQSPQLMETLRRHLHDTRSTTEDFYQRLVATEYGDANNYFGVLDPLFQIIYQDAVSLLKLLHKTLDGVNAEILDEMKMEEKLSIWRELISRAQLEIPELKRSMGQFFSFFGVLHPESGSASANQDNNISRSFHDISTQIDEMLQRLQTASSSLTSNMALLDSRRSISEARAVTKLTELAFFFIPLTFAASLFGMQVDTFENRAPLSTFIILGVAFTAFSYLVRLTIRSQWLRSLNQAYDASIKVYADSKRQPIRQKGSVPASLFLQWLGYEIRYVIASFMIWNWRWLTETLPELLSAIWDLMEFVVNTLLMVGIIAAGPIAVIWTRKMDHSVQAIVTIVILVSVIGLVAIPYWRNADPDTRSAIPNLIKKRFRNSPFGKSRLLLAIVICASLAIPVVPIAVIWTKPVSAGIKAAVTVVIVLVVLIALISWGIYHLVAVARMPLSESGSSRSSLADD